MDFELAAMASHYANQAMKPGWWKWSRQAVADIEASDPAMRGLGMEVGKILKLYEFKPKEQETECFDCEGAGCACCGGTGKYQPIRGRAQMPVGAAHPDHCSA